MSAFEALNARDDLRELADRYEQVAALDVPLASSGGTGIGARLPQGAQEVLDADEIDHALRLVDETVFHWCMTLLDAEQIDDVPDQTPARARLVAEHVGWLLRHEGERYALDFLDNLAELKSRSRGLSERGTRRVPTHEPCPHWGCAGRLFLRIDDAAPDDGLHCNRCENVVPFSVWHKWPHLRSRFITVAHAARLWGTTAKAVTMRASREKWRRIGRGPATRYLADDVRRGLDVRRDATEWSAAYSRD